MGRGLGAAGGDGHRRRDCLGIPPLNVKAFGGGVGSAAGATPTICDESASTSYTRQQGGTSFSCPDRSVVGAFFPGAGPPQAPRCGDGEASQSPAWTVTGPLCIPRAGLGLGRRGWHWWSVRGLRWTPSCASPPEEVQPLRRKELATLCQLWPCRAAIRWRPALFSHHGRHACPHSWRPQ